MSVHFIFFFFSVYISGGDHSLDLVEEERANLSAFRTFVRFALVWFCLFPLPLGVWEGLLFVIVAFPGFFSYLFSFLVIPQTIFVTFNLATVPVFFYIKDGRKILKILNKRKKDCLCKQRTHYRLENGSLTVVGFTETS